MLDLKIFYSYSILMLDLSFHVFSHRKKFGFPYSSNKKGNEKSGMTRLLFFISTHENLNNYISNKKSGMTRLLFYISTHGSLNNYLSNKKSGMNHLPQELYDV